MTREKKAFEVSCGIITSQGGYIKSKTWWLVRDNLRGQAYTMKANMKAINAVMDKGAKKDADAAYKKFWSEIDQRTWSDHRTRTDQSHVRFSSHPSLSAFACSRVLCCAMRTCSGPRMQEEGAGARREGVRRRPCGA